MVIFNLGNLAQFRHCLSSIVIFHTNNIIFTEVASLLNFNKNYRFSSLSGTSVSDFIINVDMLPCLEWYLKPIKCNYGLTLHKEPVFLTFEVFLVTQPMAGTYSNSLYLVGLFIKQDFPFTPGGSTIGLHI